MRAKQRERADLEAMLADAALDADMRALAAEELPVAEKEIEELTHAIRVSLLPKDAADEGNVILEVRAGTGGDEAALFAGDLFRMYVKYAESRGWKVDVLSASEGAAGGYKEIIAEIEGRGAFARFKYESGVHRVQRVPATETQGRIHTSAATVAVMPEASEVDLEIKETDLRIETMRAGGAGGQHVNKTESAIRITHIPTSIVVMMQEERSQHNNSAKAMALLRSRILDGRQQKLNEERAEDRKTPSRLGRPLAAHPHLQFSAGTAHRPPRQPDPLFARPHHRGRRARSGHRRAGGRAAGASCWRNRRRGDERCSIWSPALCRSSCPGLSLLSTRLHRRDSQSPARPSKLLLRPCAFARRRGWPGQVRPSRPFAVWRPETSNNPGADGATRQATQPSMTHPARHGPQAASLDFVRLPPYGRGQTIGLLGGSFNPPHQGHRLISELALRRLWLDRVWWLASPGNPLKSHAELAELRSRLEAARALSQNPRVSVSGLEAEIGSRFTCDTLRWLKQRAPGARFVWIMGADNLIQFHRWRHWRDIADLVPILVIDRPGSTLRATSSRAALALSRWRRPEGDAHLLPYLPAPALLFLHGPRSELSSTNLRRQGRAQG